MASAGRCHGDGGDRGGGSDRVARIAAFAETDRDCGGVEGRSAAGRGGNMGKKQATDAVAPPARATVRNISALDETVSLSETKIAGILQCRILRNGKEVAPETILDSGDTVQLRILSLQNGAVRVEE